MLALGTFIVALLLAQAIGIFGLRRPGYELLCTIAIAVLLFIAIIVALHTLGLV